MEIRKFIESIQTQINTELSDKNAVACLLNCYIREYAIHAGEAEFHRELEDYPFSLQSLKSQHSGQTQWVQLQFPQSHARLLTVADHVSTLGRCRFLGKPYLKKEGLPWRPLETVELCGFLLNHLSLTLTDEFNEELLEQVRNSRDITRAFLAGGAAAHTTVEDSFIRAEQSLLWGHALHPSPKSRHGVPLISLLRCSPEIAARFPLYWFELSPELVRFWGADKNRAQATFQQLHGRDTHLYPCHPWEAEHLLEQPLIQAAMARGLIKPQGFLGEAVQPTSSVRTLYHGELAVQMKFSIHVRLTNCIRKNAWYELHSAVCLTGLLQPLEAEVRAHNPNFHVMYEPLASTVDLSVLARELNMAEGDAKHCVESFGILFRENLTASARKNYRPQLAASLFAGDTRGESVIASRLLASCRQSGEDYSSAARQWFRRYVDICLSGIFYYFFKLGVVFEPHLQNTVIGFDNGLPSCIWIRDLEGTKLLPEKWPRARLGNLQARAQQSVYYDREKGWQRIAYCLLVNNFSEAIFHLSAVDGAQVQGQAEQLEQSLWQILRGTIEQWQETYGNQPELQELLAGARIPAKNNFTARLLKQADFQTGYTLLANPLALPSW